MLDNRLSSFYFFKFYLKKIVRRIFSRHRFENKNNLFNTKIIEKKFFKLKKEKKFKNVLLICLDEFEIYFFYIWIIVFYSLRGKKLKLKIVTTSKNLVLNSVIKNLNIEYIFIESLINRSIKLR